MDFLKGPGGEIVRTSGQAIKICLFVTVAAVALGLGLSAVSGGFN